MHLEVFLLNPIAAGIMRSVVGKLYAYEAAAYLSPKCRRNAQRSYHSDTSMGTHEQLARIDLTTVLASVRWLSLTRG